MKIFLINNYFKFLFFQSFIFLILFFYGSCYEGITPTIRIHEDMPTSYSGRIRTIAATGIREISVLQGETVIMECSIFNFQKNSQVSWMFLPNTISKNKTPEWNTISTGFLSQDFAKYKVSNGRRESSYRLEIFAATHNDEGLYECNCYYTPSAPKEKEQRYIKVKEAPRVVTYLSSNKVVHRIGERAVLMCTMLGTPQPIVSWQRNGGLSSFIRGKGKYSFGQSLVIESVQSDDSGQYICKGENDVGTLYYQVKLEVYHGPKFRLYPLKNMVRQRLNCHLELLCIVSSYPPLSKTSIKWVSTKKGTLTPGMDRYKVRLLEAAYDSYFLSLSLEPVLAEDFSDEFTCMAANSIGEGSESLIIQETDEKFPGRTGQIICAGVKISSSLPIYLILFYCTVAVIRHFS